MGPLVCISDLPSCAEFRAHLFADDCLLYRRINSSVDAKALLINWSSHGDGLGGRSPLEYLDMSVETGPMTDYKTCHLLEKVLCISSQ